MKNKVVVNGIDVLEDIEYKEELIEYLKDLVSKQHKLLKLYIDLGNKIQVLDDTLGYGIFEIDEIKNICNEIRKENSK